MGSGASGVACLDASLPFLPCARECRLYSALSIIAPSVNVLRRTRRKPSTIRGAAPDVVIGQSTAARAGAHPYRRRRSGSVLSLLRFSFNQKQRSSCRFLFRTLLGQERSTKCPPHHCCSHNECRHHHDERVKPLHRFLVIFSPNRSLRPRLRSVWPRRSIHRL